MQLHHAKPLDHSMKRVVEQTMKFAILPDAAKDTWHFGSLMPISISAATASLSIRSVSLGSSLLYHRLTVYTPSHVSPLRNIFQASTVYNPFSLSENAPAPVPTFIHRIVAGNFAAPCV